MGQPREGEGRVFMEDTPGDPHQTIRQAGTRPDWQSPTGRGKTTTSMLSASLQPHHGIISISHQIQTCYRFNIQKLPVAPCGGCLEGLGLRAWSLLCQQLIGVGVGGRLMPPICSFPFNSRPADHTWRPQCCHAHPRFSLHPCVWARHRANTAVSSGADVTGIHSPLLCQHTPKYGQFILRASWILNLWQWLSPPFNRPPFCSPLFSFSMWY